MSDNMKKFGLEFVLENKSKQAFAQIMDQQRRLEKQLNNNIKAFNKFQSAVNNTSLESSIKKMDKLTNSVKRYNDALAGAKGGSLDPTGGGGLSGAVKDFMTADYLRDSIGNMSNTIISAFDSMPFGQLYSGFASNMFDGIATSIATGSFVPAIIGAIQGGVQSAVNVYTTASDLVHNAIYSAFQKGSQLIMNAITTYVPQTLERSYDQAKLNAVLGDDKLGQQLTAMGVQYAKDSSLSLQDVDYVLPNLVMANKSTGVQNDKMAELIQAELEAITRLNFKDSGQGAGVQGSLVAIQEMLSGDFVSLQRRFEMGGASIDRIKDAQKNGSLAAIEQLIKELESMGVTDDALKKLQKSTQFKLGFIEESLTDFFTNPNTGIMASLIAPFEPAIDKIANFFETGGGLSGQFKFDELTRVYEEMTVLESLTEQFRQVLGKIGEFGMKLGESFFNGFVTQVDWEALWGAVNSLLDTISTYFTPAFEILAQWVNDTFIPWLDEINELLQDESIRQGILDFITGLTDIATRSLNMATTIIEKMPLFSDLVNAVGGFVSGVQSVVDSILSGIQTLSSILKTPATSAVDPTGSRTNSNRGAQYKTKKEGNAKGLPYVPYDGYETIL
ncbi:MAG: hypothetical protein J6D47_00935, partial [Peptostreptococcaceae bacterium]|nr:hypothetical protein [Peptostreptococcaceae bacterium]